MPFKRVPGLVFTWIQGPGEPPDPGWGVTPPIDPGYGGGIPAPIDPGWGIGAGLRPGHDLPGSGGHPWLPGYIGGPHPGHGLPGGGYPSGGPIKPPAAPILPVDPDWDVPVGRPGLPGHWRPVDPGYGLPPVWGFEPVDPGWGVGTPPTPGNELPGHWVPIDPGWGKPEHPCGTPKPVKPIWVWIAEIGPDFGLKPAQPK